MVSCKIHSAHMRFFVVLSLSMVNNISCFIWKLNETISPSRTITFSERYMFQSNVGPKLLTHGDAYIETDVTVTMLMTKNISYDIVFAVFSSDEAHHHDALTLTDMCYHGTGSSSSIADDVNNKWASDVSLLMFRHQNTT